MSHFSIAPGLSAPRSHIEIELLAVLGSSHFRNSKQSTAFLRYVVEQALDGNSHTLKERTIGACLFGRKEDYDTSSDSFVRVRANDVRRRLACYYESNAARAGIRIDLAPGTYAPLFRDVTPTLLKSRWRVSAQLLKVLLFGSAEVIQQLGTLLESQTAR